MENFSKPRMTVVLTLKFANYNFSSVFVEIIADLLLLTNMMNFNVLASHIKNQHYEIDYNHTSKYKQTVREKYVCLGFPKVQTV